MKSQEGKEIKEISISFSFLLFVQSGPHETFGSRMSSSVQHINKADLENSSDDISLETILFIWIGEAVVPVKKVLQRQKASEQDKQEANRGLDEIIQRFNSEWQARCVLKHCFDANTPDRSDDFWISSYCCPPEPKETFYGIVVQAMEKAYPNQSIHVRFD